MTGWASLFLALLATASMAASSATMEKPKPSAWSFAGSLAIKESFDDNLLLQDVTSNAFKEAFITTITPRVALTYRPGPSFGADFNYAPEANLIHSGVEEDFVTHRFGLGLGGQSGRTTWDIAENLVWIDGSEVGPSFFGPGGPPAAGAPQIRDRREALVQRGAFKLKQNLGEWFLRPSVMGYWHDFRAEHRSTPGYQNYVDRTEWNAGLDAGTTLLGSASVLAGYRYGEQRQAKLLNSPVHFDSTYHRALAGVEGKPWNWLQVTVSVGPEFRFYGDAVAPGFQDQDEVYLFADASASIQATKKDILTLSAKRFQQPGFGGRSAYLDETYDLVWRHKLTPEFTLGAGVRAYGTEFLKPALRDDWIISPNALVSYAPRKDLTFEASYIYDQAYSVLPNMEGREYSHHLVALGVRYLFR